MEFIKKVASELRKEATRLETYIRKMRAAADLLDPPRKEEPQPVRPKPSADAIARLRRDGLNWADVRKRLKTDYSRTGLVNIMRRAGYTTDGVKPSTGNGGGVTLPMGTAGHTSHPTDPDAAALRRDLVHTEG